MFLMIDNYDSFVFNLASYFEELGQQIIVKRNDKISVDEIADMDIKGIIISPGPKDPRFTGASEEIIRRYCGKIPILGVCLGHQTIGHCFGGSIVKGDRPMHGKVSLLHNTGTNLFKDIPSTIKVTRYHSLVIANNTLPKYFTIDATCDDNKTIMAISHKNKPIFGVQFHPEAILTEYGHKLLANYVDICDKWWRNNNDNN